MLNFMLKFDTSSLSFMSNASFININFVRSYILTEAIVHLFPSYCGSDLLGLP